MAPCASQLSEHGAKSQEAEQWTSPVLGPGRPRFLGEGGAPPDRGRLGTAWQFAAQVLSLSGSGTNSRPCRLPWSGCTCRRGFRGHLLSAAEFLAAYVTRDRGHRLTERLHRTLHRSGVDCTIICQNHFFSESKNIRLLSWHGIRMGPLVCSQVMKKHHLRYETSWYFPTKSIFGFTDVVIRDPEVSLGSSH